ncbi:MAG TPA: zinc-ribbon domain-containing protein, partial [Acidovorax temperans]|nr:zinc-ribbon domain-containing protein [Acidovorax temperans]
MSQITRCPACSTQFKVVADQLRISDGWVRCGHCAEVFDASESLMPAPPPALLPDVSLTDVRPPPMPVARADDSSRAWGAPPAPVQKAFSRVVVEPDAPSGNAPAPSGAGVLAEAPFARPAEVLSVPDPVPPAFLAAEPPLVGAEPPPIFEPAATFAWKGADAPSVPPKAPVAPPPP